MRLTAEQKREIERVILQTNDALWEIEEKTGLSISVSAYGKSKDSACIFIHTNRGVVYIDKRSEIEGIFNSDKWRNRKVRKN